jgi:hypothetical protein
MPSLITRLGGGRLWGARLQPSLEGRGRWFARFLKLVLRGAHLAMLAPQDEDGGCSVIPDATGAASGNDKADSHPRFITALNWGFVLMVWNTTQ